MAELALLKGDTLELITSTYKNCPKASNIHNFAPLFRVKMPYYKELDLVFPIAKKMEEFVAQIKPDLIHISTPGPVGLAGRKIAKKYNIPLVGTYHTDFPAYIKDNTGSKFLKKMTDRWIERFYVDFIHVFSRSEIYAQIMQEELGIKEQKISIIRAGTNLKRFSSIHNDAKIWQKYGVKKEGVKVLYVGRISKEKNIPFLLECWKELKKNSPSLEAQLVLIGDGSYKSKALKLRKIGVNYLGAVIGEDLSYLYGSADLFAFASVTDTLGQVVMEASASGLPVIVSDIGGPKSLLNPDLPSGYTLATQIDLWVEHMKILIEDQQKRTAFGASAQQHMRAFTIENSYDDFMGMHKKLFASLS